MAKQAVNLLDPYQESYGVKRTGNVPHVLLETLLGEVGLQNPLPVDNTRIYARDINVEASDIGDFTGEITDFFDDLTTVSHNTTATNPKVLKFIFNDTIQTSAIGLGCNDITKNFSNVVVKTLGSAEAILYTYDASQDDDTKRNSWPSYHAKKPATGLIVEFHTADPVSVSNVIVFKSNDVNARLDAVSSLTGYSEIINSYRNTLNTNPAWVHRKIVNSTFHQHTATETTLATPATSGDTSIVVTDATGFVTGNYAKLVEGALTELGIITITNVVGTTIYLDRPLANSYTVACEVIKVLTDMAIAGGTLASPQIFQIEPPVGTVWQITRIMFSIITGTEPDDSKFGGIAALTNGVCLRTDISTTEKEIFANWKINGDMKLDMFDVTYTAKAGGGNHGLNSRWTFTNAQVVRELNGAVTPVQKIEFLIQDPLNTLISFKATGQGRIFSP